MCRCSSVLPSVHNSTGTHRSWWNVFPVVSSRRQPRSASRATLCSAHRHTLSSLKRGIGLIWSTLGTLLWRCHLANIKYIPLIWGNENSFYQQRDGMQRDCKIVGRKEKEKECLRAQEEQQRPDMASHFQRVVSAQWWLWRIQKKTSVLRLAFLQPQGYLPVEMLGAWCHRHDFYLVWSLKQVR